MRLCHCLSVGAQNIQGIIDIGIGDRFVTSFSFESPHFWRYSNNVDTRVRRNEIITKVRESGTRKNIGKG